ncbi:MAG: hypothetical protein V1835_02385 [Candidatus Micrarchaeota archaeon]
MKSKSPFKIRLSVEELELSAEVTNVSKVEQYFLENQLLQPSLLKLSDALGKQVKFNDLRPEISINWLKPRDEYKKLKPGESRIFHKLLLSKNESSSYHVNWYPFDANLAPGTYRGMVEWSSKADRWEEFDTHNEMQRINGKMKGVWLGKVCSNSAELVLE